MSRSIEEVLEDFTPEQRERIDQRTEELLREYYTLEALRKARDLTQKTLAERLNINQENVSRLERRSDIMLSTLRNHIKAMGGDLSLVVQFPGQEPVQLIGLGEDDSDS